MRKLQFWKIVTGDLTDEIFKTQLEWACRWSSDWLRHVSNGYLPDHNVTILCLGSWGRLSNGGTTVCDPCVDLIRPCVRNSFAGCDRERSAHTLRSTPANRTTGEGGPRRRFSRGDMAGQTDLLTEEWWVQETATFWDGRSSWPTTRLGT